jgi:hypothetical protein
MTRTHVSAGDTPVNSCGAVAQLGERMTGSHEVRGSIPLGSTIFGNPAKGFFNLAERVYDRNPLARPEDRCGRGLQPPKDTAESRLSRA